MLERGDVQMHPARVPGEGSCPCPPGEHHAAEATALLLQGAPGGCHLLGYYHCLCLVSRSAHNMMWCSSTKSRTFLAPTPKLSAVPIHGHDLLAGKCSHTTKEGLRSSLNPLNVVSL